MQFGVVIETMRREGYELTLSAPKVLITEDADGVKMEPWETIIVEMPKEFTAGYIDRMGSRNAEIKDMLSAGDACTVICDISSRNFLGMRTWLREATGGQAVIQSQFAGRRPAVPPAPKSRKGMMIAGVNGSATGIDLAKYNKKGTLFVSPGTMMYKGMIIGEFRDQEDTEINVCHNYAKTYEAVGNLPEPRSFYLEQALSYIADDECIEVTPKNIRLRKTFLSGNTRDRIEKANRIAGI